MAHRDNTNREDSSMRVAWCFQATLMLESPNANTLNWYPNPSDLSAVDRELAGDRVLA